MQLYQRTDELIKNVGLYLSEGLNRGEGVLAITTPEHRKRFVGELERLGIDICAAIHEKQLLWLDAGEILPRFNMSGWPDWNKFEIAIGSAVREIKPALDDVGFRAYGEMVDILWNSRKFAAALRLEHFWNKLLSRFSFSLYCAYAVGASDQKNGAYRLDEVLSAHTHVIPSDSCRDLSIAAPISVA